MHYAVPLQAYTPDQELTIHPNATGRQPLFNSLVPSILKPDDYDSFAPQVLRVGDTIRPNGSVYDYTITGAWDGVDLSKPISSFLYSNNPLSDACDVVSIPASIPRTRRTVLIFCRRISPCVRRYRSMTLSSLLPSLSL